MHYIESLLLRVQSEVKATRRKINQKGPIKRKNGGDQQRRMHSVEESLLRAAIQYEAKPTLHKESGKKDK
jgi:hypothetical protein